MRVRSNGPHTSPAVMNPQSTQDEAEREDVLLRAASLLILTLTALSPVRAADRQSLYVDDLTWTELRDRVAGGDTTVIIPIGGTEQNGPHMALGKHNIRVRLLAGKIAEALGNTLVAPVIAYVPEGGLSPPSAHMRYPGTITTPEDAFARTLEYAARSFKLHGFRDVVLLGDHGSYQSIEVAVAGRLNREWAASGARVHAAPEYYRAATSDFAKLLADRGYAASESGKHAGLSDTSLMMALDPRLVRTDRLRPGEGVEGDPSRSSAALGQLGVDLIVNETVETLRKAIAAPRTGLR